MTQSQPSRLETNPQVESQVELATVPAADLVTVSEAVQALCRRGNVTWKEYESLRLNGFERDALYPHLDTEALCQATEAIRAFCLPQRHFPPLTYEEALTHCLVPLLLACCIFTTSAGYSHQLRHPNLTQLRQGNSINFGRCEFIKPIVREIAFASTLITQIETRFF